MTRFWAAFVKVWVAPARLTATSVRHSTRDLQKHARGIIPERTARDRGGLADLFVEMAEGVQTSVARVASPAGAPAALAEYLAQHNLGSDIRMAPDEKLNDIPWQDRPTLSITRGRSDGNDEVGVTAAFSAVAETGTLMLHSGPSSPTTLNFLPDNHVVVLRARARLSVPMKMAGTCCAQKARCRARLISSPARRARGDIEQTLMLGAHGPRRLHIILIEDENG